MNSAPRYATRFGNRHRTTDIGGTKQHRVAFRAIITHCLSLCRFRSKKLDILSILPLRSLPVHSGARLGTGPKKRAENSAKSNGSTGTPRDRRSEAKIHVDAQLSTGGRHRCRTPTPTPAPRRSRDQPSCDRGFKLLSSDCIGKHAAVSSGTAVNDLSAERLGRNGLGIRG